jgi:hypothetical protein
MVRKENVCNLRGFCLATHLAAALFLLTFWKVHSCTLPSDSFLFIV